MRLTTATTAAVASLACLVTSAPAYADHTQPYGDRATARIGTRLDAVQRMPWLATTLDAGGYRGPRHAEIVRVPEAHGRRWVGIIHVPRGKAGAARRALDGVWLAQQRGRFVVPLVNKHDTRGGTGPRYRMTARWAADELGWRVRRP